MQRRAVSRCEADEVRRVAARACARVVYTRLRVSRGGLCGTHELAGLRGVRGGVVVAIGGRRPSVSAHERAGRP